MTESNLIPLQQDAEVLNITQAISRIVVRTPTITVESDADQQTAAECLGQIQTIAKQLEAKRKELTDPLERQKKAIIAFFKQLETPLGECKELINSKVMSWRTRKRAAQEKADRMAREAVEQAQQQGLPVMPAFPGEQNVQLTAQPLFDTPAAARVETADGGMLYERSNWTYRITDMNLLIACAAAGVINPLYLMVDASYMKIQIKAATIDGECSLVGQVPGVEIYNDKTLVSRRGGRQ
jgi:hypothetical protein